MTDRASRGAYIAGLVGAGTAAVATLALGPRAAAALGTARAAGRALLEDAKPFPNKRVKPGVPINARTAVMLTPVDAELAAPVTYQRHRATDEFTIWAMNVQTGGQWIARAVLAP